MDYTSLVDTKRLERFFQLIDVIDHHISSGFEKIKDEKGIQYVVPFTLYPSGYHVSPNTPLPFLSVIAQKNYIVLYHLGIYADIELLNWFKQAYAEQVSTKLNMGKSCIRFANTGQIPYSLIGELIQRMTLDQWITV